MFGDVLEATNPPTESVRLDWKENGTLNGPRGLCCVNDTIFICDLNNNRIRATSIYHYDEYWDEVGCKDTVAPRYGPQHEVSLVKPRFIWAGLNDEMYITCSEKDVILEWRCGMISKKTGGARGFYDGSRDHSMFQNPRGGCVDPNTGKIYVADFGNDRIRVIEQDGSVTSIGIGGRNHRDGPFETCGFSDPSNLYWDAATSTMFVLQDAGIRILHLGERRVSTFSGNGTYGFQDGPLAEARYSQIYDMKRGGDNLYITDNGNGKVRVIDPEGNVSTLSPPDDPNFINGSPFCLTFTKLGDLVVSFAIAGIIKVLPNLCPPTDQTLDLMAISALPASLLNSSLNQSLNEVAERMATYIDIGQDVLMHAGIVDLAYPSLRSFKLGNSHPRTHLKAEDVTSFLYTTVVPPQLSAFALIDLYVRCSLLCPLSRNLTFIFKPVVHSAILQDVRDQHVMFPDQFPKTRLSFCFCVSLFMCCPDVHHGVLSRGISQVFGSNGVKDLPAEHIYLAGEGIRTRRQHRPLRHCVVSLPRVSPPSAF